MYNTNVMKKNKIKEHSIKNTGQKYWFSVCLTFISEKCVAKFELLSLKFCFY